MVCDWVRRTSYVQATMWGTSGGHLRINKNTNSPYASRELEAKRKHGGVYDVLLQRCLMNQTHLNFLPCLFILGSSVMETGCMKSLFSVKPFIYIPQLWPLILYPSSSSSVSTRNRRQVNKKNKKARSVIFLGQDEIEICWFLHTPLDVDLFCC